MTYFADLSPYEYFRSGRLRTVYNVGWLDAAREFATGPVDADIVARLERITCYSVNQTRGLQYCDFCSANTGVIHRCEGKNLLLGDAEIRVFSAGDEIFAAPNMLLHYIAVHGYLPPPAFLEAVNTGPVPPAQAYFDQLKAWDYAWVETSIRDRPVRARPPLEPPSWMAKR